MDEPVSLAADLKRLGPEPLYFRPNPGNGGDALIAHATYLFFARERIAYRRCRGDEDLAGKVVVHGGGGNLVEYYDHCADFVARHHDRAARLVILPHTILGHQSLLAELGSNVTIYCRERSSYEHVSKNAPRVDVRIADDMALMLDPASFRDPAYREMERGGRSREFRARLRRWRRRRFFDFLRRTGAKLWREPETEPRVVYCMREDVERNDRGRPEDNIDLSQQIPFEFDMLSEASVAQTSRLFFEFLDDWDVVHTNRLHVAVAAGLLDKRVYFYANANTKNEAMYRDALAQRFPKMSWAG